ncbi:unnamed protein product [Blepharisma stoltei]|uniref:Receptor ligand binding region domain-containing protein n=1 Tax=Blepharisma stoltei TaxID=1481888 RepID=A0AAU9I8I3_9CILI|nr:unnamed protein product [Blepharisma stoltei]
MKSIKYLFFASFVYCQIYIELLYSSYTDFSLVSAILDSLQQKYFNQVEVRLINLSIMPNQLTSEEMPQIAIDLTFALSLSSLIKQYASQNEIILFSIQKPSPSFNEWEFFTHPSEETQLNALAAIISYLNWEKIIFITDSNFSILDQKFSNKNKRIFFFPSDEDQKSAEILIKKEIKPYGCKNIVILNKGKAAKYLIKSITDANLLNLGTGIILGSKSWQNATENGLFGLVENGLEKAEEYYSYEVLGIEKLVNLVLSCNQCLDTKEIRNYLEKSAINHQPISNFTVLNVKNSEKVRIGYIFEQELVILESPIFIGNSSFIPNSPYTNLTISMSDGVTNPDYPNSLYSDKFKEGAKYALMCAKRDKFIDGFEILVTHTDCGAEVYNPKFSLSCFKKLKNNLGVGLLTAPVAPTALGNIASLRALNISIPHISEYATAEVLASKQNFPEFMRVTKDNRYNAEGVLNLFTIFQWKRFIILYDDTPGHVSSYQFLLSSVNKTGIEIVNSVDKRKVKQNYNHSDYSTYKPWMEEFLQLRARVIFLLILSPSQLYFVEDLYNTGFRRGDAILFLYNRASSAFVYESDPSEVQKLWELYYGTVTMDQAEWVGNYGQKVKSGFLKAFTQVTDYRCFSYDSAMLLLNGIKYTIDQGENVEDFTTLNTNLRLQRFLGCSGTISIDKNSNDRSKSVVGIFNIRWIKESNILYDYQIGTYDLGSQQLFTFTDNIIWYDNSSNVPSDLITYSCDFDPKIVVFSMNGARVLYAVDSCALISIFIAFSIIRKCWYHVKIEKLIEPRATEFGDYLAYLVIFIDFLQFLFLGPNFSEYDKYSNKLVKISMFRLDLESPKHSFISYFYASLAFSFIIIIFSIQSLWRWQGRYKIFFLNIYEKLPEWIIPFLWNICYTPIIFTLLGVFQCDQSIGNEITDSFMEEDCTIFCWKDSHIKLVVLSIITLVLYLPVAMHLKPFWDYSVASSNVQVRPTFLLEKRAFQAIIVVLNNTILAHQPSLYGLIYILLIMSFISLQFLKEKPYNYSRCNLWLCISYIAVIWNVGISSIYEFTNNELLEKWTLLQYLGWAFLLVAGVLIQKKYCPGLLYSEHPPNIALFFRFSLSKKIPADQINKMNKEKTARHLMSSIRKSGFSSFSNQSMILQIYEKAADEV